jgi:membrane fusion protein, heavy metal efflux system
MNTARVPEAEPRAGETAAARPSALTPSPSPSFARWGALAGALVLGVVGFVVLSGDDADRAPVVQPDVPRVEGNRIHFSEAFAKRIGLEVAAVRKGPLTPTISVVGTVALDPEYVAAVGTRLKGLVRSVAKFEGDTVEKGDILGEIDSAELGEAQASISMLRAERQAAEINAARESQLLEQRLSTAREAEVAATELKKYDALLDAANQRVVALGGQAPGGKVALGRYVLRSPIDGTIIDRNVSTGQSVEADLVAFRIGNLDYLWVELAVYEQHLGSIAVGDAVSLQLLSNPEVVIEGRIEHIGAQVNPDTRSADVRIEVDNRDRKLLPGQAVTAEIQASRGAAQPVLFVPRSAITVVDGQPTVFVSTGENQVRVVEVTLGKSDGDDQQIIAGLKHGERVVSSGVFALKSELFR